MAFRCSTCGGSVVFDVASQHMKCLHCGNFYIPEDYKVRDESTQTDYPEAQLTVFLCQNCGAELESTEESMIGYCPYCGGQSMLSRPADRKDPVERLIPFQLTKENCAASYQAFAKKVPYLPKELKDPGFLENFTGVYMPYVEYDVVFGQSHITGTKTVESNSRYDVVNTYEIGAQAAGVYRGAPFDASRYLDDEIARQVQPFDPSLERPFHPAYLSGFYADTATVDAAVYDGDAAQAASKDVVSEVASQMSSYAGIAVNKGSSSIDAGVQARHPVLLPHWFLTWRKGDRVAYAVVNGQSGKVVSDLPVNMKSFAVGCGVIAAVLFAVLELFFQPTPMVTSVLSLIAGLFMAIAIKRGTKRLYDKQTHADDKGWQSAEAGGQNPQNLKKKKKSGCGPVSAIVIGVIVVVALLFIGEDILPELNISIPFVIGLVVLAYSIYAVIRVGIWQRILPEKHAILSILILLAALILNVVVVFLSPVNDGWYYVGDGVCILGLVLAAVGMLRLYNAGTTRPLPKLFDRNGVGT